MRNLLFLLYLGLVVYTLIDIARSDDDERLGAPRIVWGLLVVVVPLAGSVVWLVVSRSRRASRAAGPGGGTSGRGGRAQPVAPDDDPEFLWRLEQDRRRRHREEGPADDVPPNP